MEASKQASRRKKEKHGQEIYRAANKEVERRAYKRKNKENLSTLAEKAARKQPHAMNNEQCIRLPSLSEENVT